MDSRILPLARGCFSAEVLGSLYDVTHTLLKGFPRGSGGKESACGVGDLDLIPGLGRSSGGGHGNPLQYSCLENCHGQTDVGGYSPWNSPGQNIRVG